MGLNGKHYCLKTTKIVRKSFHLRQSSDNHRGSNAISELNYKPASETCFSSNVNISDSQRVTERYEVFDDGQHVFSAQTAPLIATAVYLKLPPAVFLI